MTKQTEYVWPLPVLDDGNRKPVISDHYHMRSNGRWHNGVDIMYRSISSDPQYVSGKDGLEFSDYYKRGARRRTKGFYVPPGTPAIACVAGKVFSAKRNPRGYSIAIGEIGSNLAFYYQHLESDIKVRVGDFVELGQIIGTVGANPAESGGIIHLHFEIWDGGPMGHMNPAIFLNEWQSVGLDGYKYKSLKINSDYLTPEKYRGDEGSFSMRFGMFLIGAGFLTSLIYALSKK